MAHHDHEHGSELSETQRRVRALETILTEKGYVDPAALDVLIETYETKVGPHNGARVVARAWADPEYRAWLFADGGAAITSLGYVGRQGENIVALENTPRRPQHGRLHAVLVLPVARPRAPAGLVQVRALPLARGDPIRAACCGTSASTCRPRPRSACGTRPPSCATSSCPMRPAGTDGWSEDDARRARHPRLDDRHRPRRAAGAGGARERRPRHGRDARLRAGRARARRARLPRRVGAPRVRAHPRDGRHRPVEHRRLAASPARDWPAAGVPGPDLLRDVARRARAPARRARPRDRRRGRRRAPARAAAAARPRDRRRGRGADGCAAAGRRTARRRARPASRPATGSARATSTRRPTPACRATSAASVGTVVLVHGAHVFPDANAHGEGEDPQWLYTVRFAGRDLWGPDSDPTVSVSSTPSSRTWSRRERRRDGRRRDGPGRAARRGRPRLPRAVGGPGLRSRGRPARARPVQLARVGGGAGRGDPGRPGGGRPRHGRDLLPPLARDARAPRRREGRRRRGDPGPLRRRLGPRRATARRTARRSSSPRPTSPDRPSMSAAAPPRSHVVTGGGRGVGRAIVERLLAGGDAVVALELDPAALAWLDEHGARARAAAVAGDAGDAAVAARAADAAERLAPLAGWVNNAAVFRDASVHDAPPEDVLALVTANLAPAVVGAATAVRRFLAAGTPGAIVNVSSHQAQRAVPGASPYTTAKAAIEGLTRALAASTARAGSASTRSRWARSTPAGPTRPRPRRTSRGCTRSAASAARTRSPRSSPTCSPTTRASSRAPSSRSTARSSASSDPTAPARAR